MTTLLSDLFQEYWALHAAMKNTHQKVIKTLTRAEKQAAARRLGILEGTTICFPSEESVGVVFDHAIYDGREMGRSAVQRYWDDLSPAPGTGDAVLRNAMTRDAFRLWIVRRLYPGYGLEIEDGCTKSRRFLMDHAMSLCAPEGGLMAGRCLPFPQFSTTSGAMIPIQSDLAKGLVEAMTKAIVDHDSRVDDANQTGLVDYEMAAIIIRYCLAAGALDYVRTQDLPSAGRLRSRRSKGALLPSSPCPCGSGRSYRKCCRRRR